ncbi:hypothetical protein ACP70R_011349 [Stipagrostis hirtigluma subsp. patula]
MASPWLGAPADGPAPTPTDRRPSAIESAPEEVQAAEQSPSRSTPASQQSSPIICLDLRYWGPGPAAERRRNMLKEMSASKRTAGENTGFSNKNKRACNGGGETSESQISTYKDVPLEDLYSFGYPIPSRDMVQRGMILVNTFENPFGDIYPNGVWSGLRKREEEASLVRCPYGGNKIIEGLRIEVLLPNKQRRDGTLRHYSLHYNVALVCIKDFRAVCPASLRQNSIITKAKVLAVGRFFKSGELMAASGRLTDWTSKLDWNIVSHASCKITKAGIGGPLVDVDGNFIGMNFYHWKIGTPFVFWDDLCGLLEYFKTKNTNYEEQGGFKKCIVEDDKGGPNRWPVPRPRWRDPCELDDGMDEFERKIRASGRSYGYTGGDLCVDK